MKNKDNPVPSLEKVKEILFKKDRWYDNYQDAENGIEECYKLLQNGVKNNKEQPKCKNCNFQLKQINSICDECGYDQGY